MTPPLHRSLLCLIVMAGNLTIADAQTPAPAPVATPVPPAEAAITPNLLLSPTQLFEDLAKVTKPQWRQQYRAHIERTVTSRPKASMALGAIMADLALAGMARDAQQTNNLLQDQEALEKLLGIADKMQSQRRKYQVIAESEDWPNFAKSVQKAHEKQIGLLTELRDDDLAALVTTGRWVRTWQICTSIVLAKKLENDQLTIGNSELVSELNASIDKIIGKTTSAERCLRLLSKKVGMIEKLWRQPVDATQRNERLRQTQEILDELIALLVQDQSGAPIGTKPALETIAEPPTSTVKP